MQREDRITSCCDDETVSSVGLAQGIPEWTGAPFPLEKVHIVKNQCHGRKTERVADLLPQLPIVSGFRRVQTDYRSDVCNPLPQQCRLAITGRSGNERDRLRSASTEPQKSSTGDYAALRDRRPSAARPFAWWVRAPIPNTWRWSATSIPRGRAIPHRRWVTQPRPA